jgi:hypothetical protein
MNWLNFKRLIRTIYSPNLPDVTFIKSIGLLALKIGQTYILQLDFMPEQNCKHLTQLYRHNDSPAPVFFKKLLDAAPPGYGRITLRQESHVSRQYSAVLQPAGVAYSRHAEIYR